jgi:alpha-galactosidase
MLFNVIFWTARQVGGTPVQLWMPAKAFAAPGCDQTPNATLKDGSLFDAIIAPLANYSHRGVIWFQGEANVEGHARWLGDKYGACFQAMIAGWRDSWGIGDFSFVFVQLAPYLNSGNITEVRLQQATALPAPGIGKGSKTTGMVTTIDQGDIYGGVHSHHKAPVGERAARAFMHVAYALQPGGVGGLEAFRGPAVTNATLVAVEDAASQARGSVVRVVLRFDEVGPDGLRFGDATSCGLLPNRADKHWQKNHTALNNTECSDEIELSKLAASIACCCGSPGNGSFFVCAGEDTTSVRIAEAAAGCRPARAAVTGADEVTLTARLPAGAGTVLRVAMMAVDQPGCALYSSFGLPASPAFVEVDTGSTAVPPAQRAEPRAAKGARGGGGFAALPMMGYNTWNAIHTNVDENLILKIAQVMKDTGLAASGFEYVNIDDGWEVDRGADSALTADPVRFPSGLRAISDAVHALGLKFGVYTATHEFTCQHRPGSWEHEAIDARTFCDNRVDFIKIDTCGGRCYNASTGTNAANGTTANLVAYQRFRAALEVCKAEAQHEIVEHCTSYDWNPLLPNPCNVVDAQNGCPHPPDARGQTTSPVMVGAGTGDIQSNFASILRIIDNSEPCLSFSGPVGTAANGYGGHWLDFDMLEVGNPGLDAVESRSHFTMWAGACSTLLIGTDICDAAFVGSDAHTILTNKELIDTMSQDPLGVPLHRTREPKLAPPTNTSTCQLWSKPLAGGDVGVVLFNRGESEVTNWSFDLSDVGIAAEGGVMVRDLWAHTTNGTTGATGKVTAGVVAPHGVVALRLTPAKQ